MPLLLSINRKGTKIKLRKEKEQCTTNKPLGSKFLKRLGTCYYSFTYIIYSTYKYICQNCTCVFVNTICLRQPKDSARCANLQPRQVYPNVLLFSNRRIFQKKRTTAFNCVPLSSNTVSATSNQLVTVLRATCGQETKKTTHNTWPKARNARQPDFTCLIRTRDHLSLHTCPTKQSKKIKLYTNQMHQQECTFIESLTSKLRNYQKNMDKCQIIFVNIYPPPPPSPSFGFSLIQTCFKISQHLLSFF